jgi:hypothetical protein
MADVKEQDSAQESASQDPSLEEIRKALEAERAARAEAEARMARIEAQLTEERHRASTHAPRFPTTTEGWQYALQVAELRASQDESLRPYLQTLYQEYNRWAAEQGQRQAAKYREAGRLEAELTQLGVKPHSREHKAAIGLLEAGFTYEDVEHAYVSLLRETKVKEANKRAKEAQGQAANRGAIEGGEARGRPPAEATAAEPDPQASVMADLTRIYRERAPSSIKFARGREKTS